MSSTRLATASSPRSLVAPRTPPTTSTKHQPSPGTFRHPYLAEVVRRQSKTAVSAGNINAAAVNVAALAFVAVFFGVLHRALALAVSLTPLVSGSESTAAAASIASYALYALTVLFVANVLLALRPVLPYSRPATYDDIPLTPSQRQLLGLPQSADSRGSGAKSSSSSPFITPPRYTRRLSSSSAAGHSPSSQLTGASGSSILANYSPSPLSTSRYAGGFGSSPFSPGVTSSSSNGNSSSGNITGSPLFHKAVQQSHDRTSAEPAAASFSPLGRSASLNEIRRRNADHPADRDREARSPVQKGVNYKWMYDKGF